MQATAFQWRVWQAVRAIPYGDTRSYAEIACMVGQSLAARAVARACGTNPVALAIPCHRVVRHDGGPGGYRWGVDRKRMLLEGERHAALHAERQVMRALVECSGLGDSDSGATASAFHDTRAEIEWHAG